MSEVNSRTFNKVLGSFITSQKKSRDVLQSLIIFGLEQYKEHQNASFLSSIIIKCKGAKSIPTGTVKEYIKAHANVRFVKLSDGTHGFKKDGEVAEVNTPDMPWYEWEGAKHNNVTVDMDVVAQAKRLLTMLRTKLEEGHVKDREAAMKIGKALDEALTA